MTTIYGPPAQARPVHDRFFAHAEPGRGADGGPGGVTRDLCAAAYLDEGFAAAATDEVLGDRRRAVVPAIGYDLVLVLRHCLRARRLWLARDASLVLLLVVAYAAHRQATLTALTFAVYAATPALVRALRRRGTAVRHVIVAAAAFVFLAPMALSLAGILPLLAALGSDDPERQYAAFAELAAADPKAALAAAVVIAVALFAVCAAFRATMLATRLDADGPRAGSPAAEHRLAVVGGAQNGNVVLHSGYSPFPGAGPVVRAWSIALELRADLDAGGGAGPVPIDPVQLNRHVKRRLAALQSPALPERERVAGLALRDQIVASGTRWHGYALVDQQRQLPYSLAGPHAVEAVIRHPQAGARHFLRATVGADSAPVRGAHGETLLAAEDQGKVLSSFVHIAVEGGMLYVESVTTVLGPVRARFRAFERYGDSPGALAAAALGAAIRDAGPAVLLAPWRLARAGAGAVRAWRRADRADREHDREPLYDYGARADVRQLASRPEPASYVQALDAEKYAKLLERRISEAVVGFLREHRVDTAEYETRINHIHNESVTIHGDNHGAVAAGTGARAAAKERS
ncbi:hypothetical protein [Spirilliplanes yamanashiensis]|uniref:Uncharacterized protein n=1 Tax=Spirilliplanes yamanashiensis TaxID=42233 RepID=A0A8J3YDK5_9ACTN|nr:hypothetical protein [Spirilliplanes yamanashiensis]MDP9816213.1 hypothetical protein [Spirilliplanes yamanashiensis]GIJ05738.1 hypothetical protein Sya03_50900 [Spirilliplanes yamanashiensis]